MEPTEAIQPDAIALNAPPQEAVAAAETAPGWLDKGHVPSLDGLRAFSILVVLVGHLAHQGVLIPHRWYFTDVGHLGVDMFFVISGFIITLLLLREQRRAGAISLTHFYWRRAFRILPAYVCFLLGIAVLQASGQIELRFRDWIGALTYTVSFQEKPNWNIGHIWSLSVEEHFYLVWPFVFALAPRRAWLLALGYILATPLLRVLLRFGIPGLDPDFSDYCTLTRIDTIAVGCCLAYAVQSATFRRRTRVPPWGAYLATAGLVALVAASQLLSLRSDWFWFKLLADPLLIATAFAATIWLWIQHAESWFGRVLNCRPVVWVGLLSYSIYLWQQPFLNSQSNAFYTQPPYNLVFIGLLAVGSYLLVEKPILRLKDRWFR